MAAASGALRIGPSVAVLMGKITRASGVPLSRSVGSGVDGDSTSPGSCRRAASAVARISSIASGAMVWRRPARVRSLPSFAA